MAVSDVATSVGDGPGARAGRPEPHWETAADLARTVLPWLVVAPARTMLNLNVPDAPRVDVLGLRWAGLAPVGGVRTVITGRDDHGLDLDLVPNDRPVPEGTDSALLRAGWATVTPLVPASAADVQLPMEEWSASWLDGRAEGGSTGGP